jgi:hypothetical protein
MIVTDAAAVSCRYGHWRTVDLLLELGGKVPAGMGESLLDGCLGRHYFNTAARIIAKDIAAVGPAILNQRLPPKTLMWIMKHGSEDPDVCLRKAVENGMLELVVELLTGQSADGEPVEGPARIARATPDLLLLCGPTNPSGAAIAAVRRALSCDMCRVTCAL